MAEPVIIKVIFNDSREVKPLLNFPEEVVATIGSRISWRVSVSRWAWERMEVLGLAFEVYFEGNSPFNWHRQKFVFFNTDRIYPPPFGNAEFEIASGVAETSSDAEESKKGHKYGIKVSRLVAGGTYSKENLIEYEEELIEDDDPYLKIIPESYALSY